MYKKVLQIQWYSLQLQRKSTLVDVMMTNHSDGVEKKLIYDYYKIGLPQAFLLVEIV